MDFKTKDRFVLHIEVQDTKTKTMIQHTISLNFHDARVEGIDELTEEDLLTHSAGSVAALYHNMFINLLERSRMEKPQFLVDDPIITKGDDNGNIN